jgi:hypothetical protein
MNLRICTGFLTAPAVAAYTAPAAGAQSVRKLVFDLHVRDSHGREFPEKCLIEDAALQKATEARLIPGTAILIEAEPTARPYKKDGVATGGWIRELLVRRVEFLRVPKAAETTQEEAA